LGKHSVVAAWLGLLLAVVCPPRGLGFSICWIQSATGLPCPGCGLTRSLSSGIRGMLLESWHYHPMGMLILGLFLLTAAQSVLPRPYRARLAGFMQRRTVFFNSLYLGFVGMFVGFGAARAIVLWVTRVF
jgi:hypothetical protein